MPQVPVRQTALSGPVDPTHLWPSIFDLAGVANLVPVTQNISANRPLIVTAARGFGTTGALDRIGIATSNLTWPAVPEYETYHLYVDIHANGSLSPGFTTLAPVYQEYGVPSVVAGQHTYNALEAAMYVGDGAAAHRVWRVFLGLGWGDTSITALRAHAYQGRWTSELFPLPPVGGSLRIDDYWIPGPLKTARWTAVCMAADGAYYPGNELPLSTFGAAFAELVDTHGFERVDTGANPPQILASSGGPLMPATPSNWRLRCALTRSW